MISAATSVADPVESGRLAASVAASPVAVAVAEPAVSSNASRAAPRATARLGEVTEVNVGITATRARGGTAGGSGVRHCYPDACK
jgi:hypothetical protein